jgi:hypothetical protein
VVEVAASSSKYVRSGPKFKIKFSSVPTQRISIALQQQMTSWSCTIKRGFVVTPYRRHPTTHIARVAANVVCFCALGATTAAAGQTDVAFLRTRRSGPGVHIAQMVNGLESKAKVK